MFTKRSLLWLSLLVGPACGDEVIDHGATLVFSPDDLEVVDTGVGLVSVQSVFLQNRGMEALDVFLPSLPEAPFSASLGTSRIPPGGQVAVEIEFSPTSVDTFSGALRASDISGRFEAKLGLSGAGVACALVASASIDFGSVVVGNQATQSWTVTNACPAGRILQLVSGINTRACGVTGDPSAFCLDLAPSVSLGGGESVTVSASFGPSVAGVREIGAFTARACSGVRCESLEVTLGGAVVEAVTSNLRCTPVPLEVAAVPIAVVSIGEVTCQNVGSERLVVSGWQLEPGSSPDLSVMPSPQSLAPGESFDLEVQVRPSRVATIEGTLEVFVQTPQAERITIPIRTRGSTELVITPSEIDFGEVSLTAPARRGVILMNVGFRTVAISEILIDTEGTLSFTSPDANAVVLTPGEAASFWVEFQPRQLGPIASNILILSNASDAPSQTLRLLGEGVQLPPCQFELSSSELDFGVISLGEHADRILEVRNLGFDDCLLTGAGLGAGDPGFTLSAPFGRSVTIRPGEVAEVPVGFRPGSRGPQNGTLALSISDPLRPMIEVSLRGEAR